MTDNIVSSMERSRRFLVVLSPDLPASRWCMFEVHLAQDRLHSAAGAGAGAKDFLVVVQEQPPKRRLNKTLAHILNNWTYLKWPGQKEGKAAKDAFFMKLRYSILRGGGGGGGGDLTPRY